MRNQLIRNERGGMALLLSVFVFSVALVVSLTSVYTYIENRAKFQSRIKANMDMGYVMEDLARAVRSSYDLAQLPGPCPTGSTLGFIDCAQACLKDSSGTPETGYPVTGGQEAALPAGKLGLCVRSAVSSNSTRVYHCAFNSDGDGTDEPSYCADLVANNSNTNGFMVAGGFSNNNSEIKNWYSKLDSFMVATAYKMHPFLEVKVQRPAVLGWILPQEALAGGAEIETPPIGGGEETGGGFDIGGGEEEPITPPIGGGETGGGETGGGGEAEPITPIGTIDCSDPHYAEAPECTGDGKGGDEETPPIVVVPPTPGGGPSGGIDCTNPSYAQTPYCTGNGGPGGGPVGGIDCTNPSYAQTPYCTGNGSGGTGGPVGNIDCSEPGYAETPYCTGVSVSACQSNPLTAACAAQNPGQYSTPSSVALAISTPNCTANPTANGCQPCTGTMRTAGVPDANTGRTISCVKLSVCPSWESNNCSESRKIFQMIKLM